MLRRAALNVAAVVLVVGAAALTPAAKQAPSCPRVVAHRTAMTLAPENTVPGIQAAADAGAPMVEMDVQFSSSSFPILMHDGSVDRTTNGTGNPPLLSLTYLTGLLAQDYAPWKTDPRFTGARVPYGYQFMQAAHDTDVDALLDMHAMPTHLMADKLATYIHTFDWADRTLVMGNPAIVSAMRGWYPTLHYLMIEYPPAGTIRSGEYLQALGVEGYSVFHTGVSAAAVAYWHSYDLAVYAWTSDVAAQDVPATWERLADAGVDAIITNDPAGLLAWESSHC